MIRPASPALLLSTCLLGAWALTACSSTGDEAPWAQADESFTLREYGTESLPAPEPASAPRAFSGGNGAFGSSELALTGTLEGSLNGIAVSQDTSQNEGYLSSDDFGDERYENLYFSIAADTGRGATMLMVNLDGGMNNAVFTEGRATSADTFASVASCSGPSLGDFPDESQASVWEMDAIESAENPGEWTVVVTSQFANVRSFERADEPLVGTVRFTLPESIR